MNPHLGPFKVVARTIYTTATDPRSKHPSGTMALVRVVDGWSDGEATEALTQMAASREILAALELFLEQVPEPPPPNCSCHIAPPCRDCEENAGQREVFAAARAAIAKAKGQA